MRILLSSAFAVAIMIGVACRTPLPRLSAFAQSAPDASDVVAALPSATAATAKSAAVTTLRPPFKPGTIACGDGLCDAKQEICCRSGEDGACAMRVPLDESDSLAPLLEKCSEKELGSSLDNLALCDDSSDCEANEVCCAAWMSSGASRQMCFHASVDGSNVCDYGELCVEGQPCKTHGTTCVRGKCRLTNAQIVCGGQPCPSEKPMCCAVDSEQCATLDACRKRAGRNFMGEVACSGPSTCPRGSFCTQAYASTACQGLVDAANTRIRCDRDSDCPSAVCSGQVRPRCAKAGNEPKFCTCP